MKNFLFLAIAFFSFEFVDAQDQNIQPQDSIYDFKNVDVKPEYPGGTKAFYTFIAKNFKTPEQEGLNGKIITTFVIEIDGSISNVKVLQDIGYDSGKETIEVLNKSGKWIPAQKEGKPVRTRFQFPITIKSGEKYSKAPKR